MELDSIDRKILDILQKNAKIPYSKIAEKAEISSSSVHKRIKQLKQEEIIKNFVTKMDPKKVGKKLKAFMEVEIESGRYKDVTPKLIERPEILELHEITGKHDLFLKLITEDLEKLNKILSEINGISGIEGTRTSIVLNSEKETTVIPIQNEE